VPDVFVQIGDPKVLLPSGLGARGMVVRYCDQAVFKNQKLQLVDSAALKKKPNEELVFPIVIELGSLVAVEAVLHRQGMDA
jgi:hypothetical protein